MKPQGNPGCKPDRSGYSYLITTTNRNRSTGRYTDTKTATPCACGHTLGAHDAERVGAFQFDIAAERARWNL